MNDVIEAKVAAKPAVNMRSFSLSMFAQGDPKIVYVPRFSNPKINPRR